MNKPAVTPVVPVSTDQPRASAAESSTHFPLPLTGVRVLDLGHVFQGPYATFLMAMAGADVIRSSPREAT